MTTKLFGGALGGRYLGRALTPRAKERKLTSLVAQNSVVFTPFVKRDRVSRVRFRLIIDQDGIRERACFILKED